jgi:hypothetical protein
VEHINDPTPDFGVTLVNAFDAEGAGAQKIPTLAKHDLAQNKISMEHRYHGPVHDVSPVPPPGCPQDGSPTQAKAAIQTVSLGITIFLLLFSFSSSSFWFFF